MSEDESTYETEPDEARLKRVASEVSRLLSALGIDHRHDPNFRDTPRRYAEYLLEHFVRPEKTREDLDDCRRAVFPSSYEGMVTVGPTQVWSMCPHHLLTVGLSITCAYLTHHQAIGLSKLARIPIIVGRQPLLQEDTTRSIADVLAFALDTDHVAVWVEGFHSCMACRGVRQNALTTTSEMRGLFRDDAGVKSEFLEAVRRGSDR